MDTPEVATSAPTFAVHFLTLGCAKNLVDSEKAMGGLVYHGFEVTADPARADVVIVNTCGFIEAAKEESVDEILRMVELKRAGKPRALVVAGCLSVRYREELQKELPEVDRFLGLVEPEEIRRLCMDLAEEAGRMPVSCALPESDEVRTEPRLLTTPAHYAWLKVAEGCSNPCTFCAIPLMRGLIRSFPPDELVAEARALVAGGVRELIVVAQDSTHYGVDLTQFPHESRPSLAGLIRRLGNEVEGLEWLRLMYAYPAHVTEELLDALAETPRVVPYLDIPIQHGSDRMLRAMRRSIDRPALLELLRSIRENLPGVALRTSVLVGFPGETEQDLAELVELLREVRFERLGVFTYSAEEGTAASGMGDQIPADEMDRRRAEILRIQQQIAADQNAALHGTTVEVLVEEVLENLPPFTYLGRTPWDAPEVDQGIYLELPGGGATDAPEIPQRLRHLVPGDLVRAEVVGSIDFDLEGVLLPEPPR
jgi:ribosomal protein S12 methylthiotransferase